MKKCNKCLVFKDNEDFHKASRNADGLYHTCKECRQRIDRDYYLSGQKTKSMAKYHARKKKLRKLSERLKRFLGCGFCSENDPCCLDFHHLDPSAKDFSLSYLVCQGCGIKAIKDEMRKCIVVCSNCHRKIHAGKINPLWPL